MPNELRKVLSELSECQVLSLFCVQHDICCGIKLALEGAERRQETSTCSFHCVINPLRRFSVDSAILGLSVIQVQPSTFLDRLLLPYPLRLQIITGAKESSPSPRRHCASAGVKGIRILRDRNILRSEYRKIGEIA